MSRGAFAAMAFLGFGFLAGVTGESVVMLGCLPFIMAMLADVIWPL